MDIKGFSIERDKLLKYEEALNVAIQIIGNNEVSDVLEEIVKKLGEIIEK